MTSTDELFIRVLLATVYVLLVIPGFVVGFLILIEFLKSLFTREIVIEKEDD